MGFEALQGLHRRGMINRGHMGGDYVKVHLSIEMGRASLETIL